MVAKKVVVRLEVKVMMARYVHVLDAEDERAVEVISDAIGPAFRKKSNETS